MDRRRFLLTSLTGVISAPRRLGQEARSGAFCYLPGVESCWGLDGTSPHSTYLAELLTKALRKSGPTLSRHA